MKGVTFVIILSVVWSIVSGIIEKRKAAAKKEASKVRSKGQPSQSQKSPVNLKVQSLRRRKKPVQPPVEFSQPEREMKQIKPLHKEECPLPSQPVRPSGLKPAKQIAQLLGNRRNLRTAMVLNEILGKPVSQR